MAQVAAGPLRYEETLADKDTTRLEAFSDGVFAVAATLLILEIRVPDPAAARTNAGLFAALAALWPSYLAFVLSFFVILIMWVNHHELIRLVRRVDYALLFANGILLLLVTSVPFATAVLARHLGTPAANAAAVAYCATFLVTGLAFNALFATIAHKRRLVHEDIPDSALRRVRRAYLRGSLVYSLSVVVALWNAAAGLVVCTSLWIVWTRLSYRSEKPSGHE